MCGLAFCAFSYQKYREHGSHWKAHNEAMTKFEINILKSRYHKFADEKISADESRIKFHISSPIEFTNGSYIIIDLWDWGRKM